MRFALAALQGAVFGIVAMRLTGSESLRFVLYGAIAFPLLSMLLTTRWPRLASVLGVVLVGLWATTCGVMAYEDPSLQTWAWIPGFAFLGLLFGACANSYLFRVAKNLESTAKGGPHYQTRSARDAPPTTADPGAPSPPPSADPWAILGISRAAEPRDIRRAYHARMAQYHPDKVATLGTELRDLAEAKSKAITAAYAALSGR